MSRTKFSLSRLETHPAPAWARISIGLRVLLGWRNITTLKEVRRPVIGLPMILVVPTAIETISPTWLTPTGTFTSGSNVLYIYHGNGISRVVGVGVGGLLGTQQSFIRGGFVPRSRPLSFYTPLLTGYPYHIPCIDRWCPFHIPCLELHIPFNCCKGGVFEIYKEITKPELFPYFLFFLQP